MIAKWLLGIMIAVIIAAALVPLCPHVWASLSGFSVSSTSAFLWGVNAGITAAVLCIVLFLVYTAVKISKRK